LGSNAAQSLGGYFTSTIGLRSGRINNLEARASFETQKRRKSQPGGRHINQIYGVRHILVIANAMAASNANPMPTPVPRGYHKLASLMSADGEKAIFRRFSRLNMLVLMSLQAELMDLEDEFEQTCIEDEQVPDSDERKKFSVNFKALKAAKAPNDLQWKALIKMKNKLREYSKHSP
jgi:hypothetical protein